MLRRSLVAHAVLLFAAVALPLAAAQPWPVCGTSGGTYTAGSKYETNLDNLALILSGNASSSLFASGTVGSSPNTVYGLLLCRGDINPSDCADCGTQVVQDVGQACNRTKDKILVYNQCYAQFSNRGDFLAATNNSGEYSLLISGTNITSTDVAGYDRAVTELLNATVRYAVENSTRLFATGQRVGNDTGFSNIYSMAQCSPDLSPAQCRSCLDGLVGQWWKTFPLNGKGARVAGPRCYLRSELGPFYTGSPMVRLPVKADGLTPASAPAPDVVPAITGGKNNSGSKILVIILPIVSVAIIMAVISLCIWNARKKRRLAKAERHPGTDTNEDFESVQSTLLSLASLQVATDNFHESNKIGEGGFGAVYKGILHGQEVAVKRMAKGSNQGLEELKNELVLVAKLHHRNLVRLVGFCLDEGERLLIYEYMSNKSLDTFLFEQKRKLDWAVRFKIIEGIARGLQYLHQDSQKKIVHRDMKASNILLDADMNPKIGDFGLARLFGQDQTREVTSRIAGTFGYMPPEYVLRGQYSTKSDVFSFGILVIEIVTGQRRNSGPYLSEQNDEDILSIVWRHWEEGAIAEMIDHSLGRNYSETEVLKCVNIGLLCVQQNPVDRPTMADVMILLNSDTTCTMPALAPRPAYLIDGTSGYSQTVTQWSGSPTIEQACSDGAMRRRSSVLHAVLLLLLVAAVALPLAAAQPWPVCGTSGGNYTAGSTYESNLLRLASTLRANASASPTLFASGVRGAGPDAVYGLLLCRGDMNPSDCFDCGTRVGDDVAQACNRTKDAILVYNQCYAQFSDTGDFLAATNNSGAYSLLISGTNISSADVAGYDRAVTELLNATVRYAVENSTRLFATGQRVGADPAFRNIYSMAQCSPDLSPAQCRSCLDGLVGQWWTGFLFPRNGEGARVAGPRCYLRSELGSGFYTGAPMVLLRADGLSPASAPAPDVVPATTLVKKNSASKILVIALPIVAVAIVAATSLCMWTVRKKSRSAKAEHLSELDASEDLESVKSTLLTLGSLQVATDNFDESKKLGEGGFGAVYKGHLFGQEVAVKRMAKGSNQGLEELKNELVLVAKLHHKNLVRLVDAEQRRQLDWATRFRIIEGVARGLQYLHQDSQKKIVHRDMKASNVLLDADLNPKIGDFGLARLFGQDQTRDVTNRIVGTFGYMAPEYVIRGQYSTKSDVFSFGILVLEIVTGQRNSGLCFAEQNEDLVWRHWTEGNIVEMIDYSLDRNYPEAEVQKCVNIATSSTGEMLRRRRSSSVVHAVLFFAAVVLPLAATQPWPQCGNGSTFTAGSTYETNLKNLALTLRTNAASSTTLFASDSRGSGPDTVYGLLLCRGDLNYSVCADCGNKVWGDAGSACNRTMDMALVYNQCYARFSNKGDFLTSMYNSLESSTPLMSSINVTSADVAGYDRAVTELLNATVRYAVENTKTLFATGQRLGTEPGFRIIYSLAQCSEMSPVTCRSCLDDLVGRWWKTFPTNVDGARVDGDRCHLRSELYLFYTGDPMVRLPDVKANGLMPSPDVPAITGGEKNSGSKILVIILPTVSVAIIAVISLCIWNVRKRSRSAKAGHYSRPDTSEDFESVKSTVLSLASLQVATDNFHESKKIGEGGFGEVYMGILSGQEVAVKRMTKGSNQGLEELKNELVLVAKLHHRNLVRLVGFCLEEGERLLVYEYMPNKSLDTFLFDAKQRRQLDWATRFKIIEGIARGLQYLHQDSQKKIVHRDMKASNILLDADMNPKIGDFGLARLFGQDQTRDITSRIAGTFGYMSPEYVMRGQYSTKSDVFSFGILVIEIVTGRRRNSRPYFCEQNDEDILSIVWRLWEEGTTTEMIDYSLGRNYPEAEVLKCVNIGLLCVQQNPVDRPTMTDVLVLLNSDTTCTLPTLAPRPTYLIDGTSSYSQTVTQWSGR
uniref:Serine/threonine-protein kinase n=1 Tax=Oryza nivara TaxID=4536 RepID=A0A0E0GYZ0_ORYNI